MTDDGTARRLPVFIVAGVIVGMAWGWFARRSTYPWWEKPGGVRGAPWYSRLSKREQRMIEEDERAYYDALAKGNDAEANDWRDNITDNAEAWAGGEYYTLG